MDDGFDDNDNAGKDGAEMKLKLIMMKKTTAMVIMLLMMTCMRTMTMMELMTI